MSETQLEAIGIGTTCWVMIAMNVAAVVYIIQIIPMKERRNK